jgi:hypothetical protein
MKKSLEEEVERQFMELDYALRHPESKEALGELMRRWTETIKESAD